MESNIYRLHPDSLSSNSSPVIRHIRTRLNRRDRHPLNNSTTSKDLPITSSNNSTTTNSSSSSNAHRLLTNSNSNVRLLLNSSISAHFLLSNLSRRPSSKRPSSKRPNSKQLLAHLRPQLLPSKA